MSDSKDVVFRYGWAEDVPVVGDWNGDGKDTPAVVRTDPVNPHWVAFLWRNDFLTNSSAQGTWAIKRSGTGAYTPVVGNWNRSGHDGIGVVEGSLWQLKESSDEWYDFYYGEPTDRPMVG